MSWPVISQSSHHWESVSACELSVAEASSRSSTGGGAADEDLGLAMVPEDGRELLCGGVVYDPLVEGRNAVAVEVAELRLAVCIVAVETESL